MTTLADLIHDDLGQEFPVSTGNAKADDPLIITELQDYVGVEYAVVRHALGMAGEEFSLSEQRLNTGGGRKIDELVFDVKPVGASEWTGRRRFFFDISAGLNSK